MIKNIYIGGPTVIGPGHATLTNEFYDNPVYQQWPHTTVDQQVAELRHLVASADSLTEEHRRVINSNLEALSRENKVEKPSLEKCRAAVANVCAILTSVSNAPAAIKHLVKGLASIFKA